MDPMDVSKRRLTQDIHNQRNHITDYQLLKDLNDSQEDNSILENDTHTQRNSHMDTHDYNIQTHTANNYIEIEVDDPNRLIIDSDNDIYNDQIILNANSQKRSNKAKETVIETNNITIQLVDEDQPPKKIPKLKKKPSNQNVVLLNDTLPKKYGSSKQMYEQIVHSNDESASVSSKQYRYVLDTAQGRMEFIDEASPDEEVYEVVEIPGKLPF